ncbi:sensor histidine kinase, partial [Petrocella sp. FN5]|uniref:sensor histidine kinase n=1 Tax=Petrocella sp. FN5 TaxID=3032002 RepID=UPI0023DCDB21
MENSYHLLISNQSIRENLYNLEHIESSYYNDQLVKLNIETELKYIMGNDFAFNSGLIESVFVFSNSDTYYSLLFNYLPNESLLRYNLDFYDLYKQQNEDIIRYDDNNNTIYYMKTIDDYITGKTLGKILLGIDFEALKGEYESDDYSDWTSVIYDDDGIYRFNSNPKSIGLPVSEEVQEHATFKKTTRIINNNEPYLVLSEHINDLDLTLINYAPTKYFGRDFWIFLPDSMYFIILSVLISIIVGIYSVSYITEPLKKITLTIADVSNSNFKEKMPPYKYKELNDLSVVYNKMIDQIQYLFNEVYEKQLLVQESELKALHAQINPHFIFNVLESITWEARISENDKIEHMITALAQLLRSNFSFTNQEKYVIEYELDYINFYLYLQTVRFVERLSYTIDISSDNLLQLYIPKFSIQTLVENAIIHGIEKKTGSSHLTIKVEELDQDILVLVKDDGIGFDSSFLDFSDNNRSFPNQPIGLQNVDRRIKLLYGEHYGIRIDSIIGQGTTAQILIPKDKEA